MEKIVAEDPFADKCPEEIMRQVSAADLVVPTRIAKIAVRICAVTFGETHCFDFELSKQETKEVLEILRESHAGARAIPF